MGSAVRPPGVLRIVFVSHSLPPDDRPLANLGGMQRHARELHDALARHPEVQLSPLTLKASWRGMHVRAAPFFISLLRRVPSVAATVRADAVLFSSMIPALLAVPLRRRLRAIGTLSAAIPLGLDVTTPHPVYQRIVPHVLRSVDLLFPISRATAAECVARGAPAAHVEVIPCGIDLTRFTDRPLDRASARERLEQHAGRLPADALLLCSVGRHVRRKGFEWFVREVMPRLPARVCYWIAGDGPETPRIRHAIDAQQLQGRVRLLGRTTEAVLRDLYAGSDLFVMPNVPVPGDMEGFGLVMLEAGASGLPVVASRLEGILDVVEEGQNGSLAEPEDAAAFADRIMTFAVDRDRLAAAGARARQLVEARFAWPLIAGRYVRALRAARAGGASGTPGVV